MSLITTIIDGIAPNPSSGLGGANEGHIQGFQDDIINGIAGGVADKTGGQCLVTQNSPLGMSVLVADGVVYIPNADYIANLATATKFYRVVIKDEDPVTIPSNTSGDTCQHGLDVVIDKITVPNEYGSNIATLVVTLGTPGAGAPAVPDNGYRLAEVEVVNGATQIATASITDTRTQISINDVVISTNIVTKTGTQTLTNKTLTSPKVGTAILDTNGNEVIKTPATTSAVNEITVTNAATGNAPVISATGGDTNINLDLSGKGTGVVRKGTSVVMQIVEGGTDLATGDGKAYFTVPEELNGMNLSAVHARVITAGTTNTSDIQIANVTDSVDMLSTKLTIDSGETGSDTAATPAVIDTSKDDVATNDLLRIDIDSLSTTKPKGLIIRLKFSLP